MEAVLGNVLRGNNMNKTVSILLLFLMIGMLASQAFSQEPVCRIAAISSPYITTLPATELGERSWIAKTAPESLERTIALVNATQVDAMIVLGPLSWSGSKTDFERTKTFLDKIKAPTYLLPGEKDVSAGRESFDNILGNKSVEGQSLNINGVHLQFTSLTNTHTTEGQRTILQQMKTGLSRAKNAKAVLLFGGAEIRPPSEQNATSPIQAEYWRLINDNKVAARFTAVHAHSVRLEGQLPIWSIPSSGWSYTPKWPLAIINVYKKKIELDLVAGDGQPLQRLIIPNPVNAARMVPAASDPFGAPTFSEDLKLKPDLTFVQLSDSQFDDGTVPRYQSRFAMDEKMNKLAVTQVNRMKPAMVFMTGDLTNKNTKTEWETFNRIYTKLKPPFYPVPGNHDTLYERASLAREGSEKDDLFNSSIKNWQLADKLAGGKATDRTALFRHFTKKDPYYTVETNGCVFICLYTGVASIEKEQMAWFRQQLERTKNAKHVFVLGHYPVLKDFGGSVQGPEADEIMALLRQYKVAAYLAGHRHRYGYKIHNGTAHVLCDDLCWGEYCAYQIYHVFEDRIIACWKPLFRADLNRPLYERVVFPEPRYKSPSKR